MSLYTAKLSISGLVFLSLALLFTNAEARIGEHRTVRVGLPNMPPLVFQGPDGVPAGLNRDHYRGIQIPLDIAVAQETRPTLKTWYIRKNR